jgi:DnaJ-class molecular chaperone
MINENFEPDDLEDEIEVEEEEDNEPPMCGYCNGTGEGSTPDTTCGYCKGMGVATSSKQYDY